MRRSRRRVSILAVVALLWATAAVVGAPSALANPASVQVSFGQMNYAAGAGETNNATFTSVGAGTVTVADSGATITPGPGCTSTGPSSASCSGVQVIVAYLGDMNDRATGNVPLRFIAVGDSGNDTLTGGTGLNQLFGQDGDDTLTGGPGQGYLTGGDGNDTLTGGAGGESLEGEAGNDDMNAGAGDDSLDGDAGNDDMQGGTGYDSANYYERSGNISVSLDDIAGDGETVTGESDNVHSDIEVVGTGSGNDTISGSARPNLLYAGAGNDSVDGAGGNDDISGGAGDDQLNGGAGDDTFSQEPGSDTYAGGAGSDFIEYYTDDNVTVRLNDTADDGLAGEGDNVRADVEEVTTGGGNDTLVGNNAANELTGGAGSDVLNGAGGSDGLNGDRGKDRITGGGGVDSVQGGSGGDTIAIKDTSKDYAKCGGGVDIVRRDRRDYAQRDCERVRT